jgi:hypothetical protein
VPDALAAQQDLELLPPVQMDRLAFEQLAHLSRLGRLPAAVLSAQANLVEPQRRQPHADSMSAGFPAAQGACSAERQHRHLPHSIQHGRFSDLSTANLRRHAADSHRMPCNQTRTACPAADLPVDHEQRTLAARLSGIGAQNGSRTSANAAAGGGCAWQQQSVPGIAHTAP